MTCIGGHCRMPQYQHKTQMYMCLVTLMHLHYECARVFMQHIAIYHDHLLLTHVVAEIFTSLVMNMLPLLI